MAAVLQTCDSTDEIYAPDWYNIVGDVTLDNGGYAGDLLKLVMLHIDESASKGELTESAMGEVFSKGIVESMKSAIQFELSQPKAQLELCVLKAQIAKMECECENDTNRTDSTISLNAAQENKLACDCCNASRQTDLMEIKNECDCNNSTTAQFTSRIKAECDCANSTDSTQAQITKWECDCANSVTSAETQRIKAECDCANSTTLAGAQSSLYGAQAGGFHDNAKQKVYETQMRAWSMVFADTSLDIVNPTIVDSEIQGVYNNLKSSVGL